MAEPHERPQENEGPMSLLGQEEASAEHNVLIVIPAVAKRRAGTQMS